MTVDKTTGTRRAIGACVALAAIAGLALTAHAQVMTAPATVKPPVSAANATMITGVTSPGVLAVAYPAPGKNPPTAATSFPAVAWSSGTATSAATPVARGAPPRSFLNVTVAISSASPALVTPVGTVFTSVTLTIYKAGVVAGIVTYSQPVLTSTSFAPGEGGMRQQLQFAYTQATTTYSR